MNFYNLLIKEPYKQIHKWHNGEIQRLITECEQFTFERLLDQLTHEFCDGYPMTVSDKFEQLKLDIEKEARIKFFATMVAMDRKLT